MIPKPGQVVHITGLCGVPYDMRAIYFAVAEVAAHQPHAEGAWLIGYELNNDGRAVDRREIYVGQLDGLRLVLPAVPRRRNTRAVPQQRARTAPATTTSGRTR